MKKKRTKRNNVKKIRVAILAGGISNERSVSLITGKEVLKNLDKTKFTGIFYDTKKDLKKLIIDIFKKKIDIAFIALHGKGGEDGSIQGFLELLNVSYTGSGITASALAMDKVLSKKLFEREKIHTPKFIVFSKGQKIDTKEIEKEIGFPCCVKPAFSGSSVGVSIVKDKKKIKNAILKAFKEDEKIIIEKYIKGKEITVGILGNEKLLVLPIIEIRPKNEFFDFKAKYDPKFSDEIVPAKIPEKISKKAKKIASKVYQLLGCRGFGRIDMIVKNGIIYVLEVNTIPGLTPNSLLPKAAKSAGISFSKLIEKIIFYSLNEKNLC